MKKFLAMIILAALVATTAVSGAIALDSDAAEPETNPAVETSAPAEDAVPAEDEAAPVEEAQLSLYDRMMACTTYAELSSIGDAASEDEVNALSDEQLEAIRAHSAELMAAEKQAPAPAKAPSAVQQTPRTVNFTNAAPLRPLEG